MYSELEILREKFPFLTVFTYASEEYIGIVQNESKNLISVYVYNNIYEKELKTKFLELGEVWWWESNRKIPINLFLKQDFQEFDFCLKNFTKKEFEIVQGPTVSLQELNQKRIKRRRIELIIEE